MRNFYDTFETLKQLFISALSIFMTVLLNCTNGIKLRNA